MLFAANIAVEQDSGAGAGGARSHPHKLWFVENLGKDVYV